MPFTLTATLVCDDVRVEDNGKLLVIGVYTPNIVLPGLPALLPTLALFHLWRADTAGQYPIQLRLGHPESGSDLVKWVLNFNVTAPGDGVAMSKFANVHFEHAGRYELVAQQQDDDRPMTVHSFLVLVQPPPA
jgi:hypothetical protein